MEKTANRSDILSLRWASLAMALAIVASPAFAQDEPAAAPAESMAVIADPASVSDAGAAVADSAAAVQPDSPPERNSGWQFSSSPYLWLAGLKGDVGVVSAVEPVGVDLSFGDIFKNLKFAFMTGFQARNGRFVGSTDFMFLSLGADDNIDIREADFVDVELDVKSVISTLTAGYRAVDQDRLYVDALAGARIYRMKTGLDLEGPRRSFSGSVKESWIDPVIGVRFQLPFDPRWSFAGYGDVGGFGFNSRLTWQLSGVIQYDINQRWQLSGGWRHLKIDYKYDGFVFDAAMDGPILGASYRF